jgi:nicotinamidase-related amidase
MLEDFVEGALAVKGIESIIPNIQLLLRTARCSCVPIFYANDAHFENDPELQVWGKHAMKGTKGSEIISALKPEKEDHVFEKHAYSAFQGSGIDSNLNNLGINTLVLAGTLTHICVMHTAADAFYRGYGIIVAQDAVTDRDERDNQIALGYMRELYNARILRTEEIVKIFSNE